MYRLDFRNPIENSPEYRSSVLTMLPYLRSLDFAKGKVKASITKIIWLILPISNRPGENKTS